MYTRGSFQILFHFDNERNLCSFHCTFHGDVDSNTMLEFILNVFVIFTIFLSYKMSSLAVFSNLLHFVSVLKSKLFLFNSTFSSSSCLQDNVSVHCEPETHLTHQGYCFVFRFFLLNTIFYVTLYFFLCYTEFQL